MPSIKPNGVDAFAELLRLAVAARRNLDVMETEPGAGKLTETAFLNLALREAGIDERRLNEIDEALSRPGCEAALAFVRTVAAVYRGPNVPIPFAAAKAQRALHAYGTDEAVAALAAARVSIPEALALAARIAVERAARWTGTCTDFAARQKRMTALRDHLDSLYARLKEAWRATDIVLDFGLSGHGYLDRIEGEGEEAIRRRVPISNSRLSDEERRRGLVYAHLAGHPEIHLGLPDWPARLVAAEAAKLAALDRKLEEAEARAEKRADARAARAAKRAPPRDPVLHRVRLEE